MSNRLVPVACLLLAIAATGERASGCTCGPNPLGQAYRSADAVFAGRVTVVAEEPLTTRQARGDATWPTRVWASFDIGERFKGVDGATVSVSPGEAGSTCAVRFVVGEEYIIFAHRSKDDSRLYTSECDPTGTVQSQAAALVYARRIAHDGKEPRVVGTLVEESPAAGPQRDSDDRALVGITITLEGGGQHYSAVTDAAGVFYFDDVPDGTYAARFALPEQYRMLYFWAWRGEDPSAHASTVRVSAETCLVQARVTRAGAITGRFLDLSGNPLAQLPLCLMPKDRVEAANPADIVAYATTDEDGSFRLEPLPTGEYALAANWPPMPKLDRPPMPDFICADKSDPTHAAVLTITPGRQIALGDMKVPAPRYVSIDVAVTDEEGKPMRAMVMCAIDGRGTAGFAWTDSQTGKARIYLPVENRYLIHAKGFSGGSVESEPTLVDPAKAPPALKLVVRRASAT
jgi:hypothetical protein